MIPEGHLTLACDENNTKRRRAKAQHSELCEAISLTKTSFGAAKYESRVWFCHSLVVGNLSNVATTTDDFHFNSPTRSPSWLSIISYHVRKEEEEVTRKRIHSFDIFDVINHDQTKM